MPDLVPCPGLKSGGTCGQMHDPTRCKGHSINRDNRQYRPCRAYPVQGCEVCSNHGGSAEHVKSAGRRRLAMADLTTQARSMGVHAQVNVPDAMLHVFRGMFADVLFLEGKVRELDQLDDANSPPELPALGEATEDGTPIVARLPQAIAGRVDPNNWKAEPHVFVSMLDDKRERLMRFGKMLREAGVEEARLELERNQGRQLASVIQGTLSALLATIMGLRSLFSDEEGARFEVAVREVWGREVPRIVSAEIGRVRTKGEAA